LNPKVLLIDAIALHSPLTGIGRYTYEISAQLQKSDHFELNYFYGYYSKKLLQASLKPSKSNLKSIITKNPLIKKLARELLNLASRLSPSSFDLYWQPNFIPNSGVKTEKIVTSIHDFSFILYRDFHPKERIEYIEKYFFNNVAKSDMIITGSEYTKREILQRLAFKEDKIKVIPHGINHELFKVYYNIKLDFELPKKYILSVGSIEPRKNLIGLLKAYTLLDKQLKQEYKLVLVGFKGWENREIMEIIEKNRESIHYLGFIADKELAQVYNLATCFVFPSFYEGFGLPPLEAMACGTPVISSNTSSLPEVGGEAVVYCNPHNTDDIKEKIEILLTDKKLQQELIAKGLNQAKKFSWEKSAQEHLTVFNEVIKR
jgi:glycosyltransferase involved in cell wall biosynthesis